MIKPTGPYINYYKKSLEEISSLSGEKKPTLCFHVCCGPCSAFPLTFLCPHFNVTIYYANSNIYPKEEYERRLNELKKLLDDLKRDYGFEVNLIVPAYKHEEYMRELEPYKNQKEGENRCLLCYAKRMGEAYDYAEANGFDYFTTVMTISRQKNSQILNQIGARLEKNHQKTKYFYSDFKKNKGIDLGREMRLKYNLYNQLYCGCEYSLEASKLKEKK